jgi:hypothetical protein
MLRQTIRGGNLAQCAQRALLPAATALPSSLRLFHSSPQLLEPAFDHKEWSTKFLKQVSNVPAATDPAQSSEALRDLVRSKLLMFTE